MVDLTGLAAKIAGARGRVAESVDALASGASGQFVRGGSSPLSPTKQEDIARFTRGRDVPAGVSVHLTARAERCCGTPVGTVRVLCAYVLSNRLRINRGPCAETTGMWCR